MFMCSSSHFDKYNFLEMSNSECFLVKENREEIQFNLMQIPKLKFRGATVLQGHQDQENKNENNEKEDEEFQARIIIQGNQEEATKNENNKEEQHQEEPKRQLSLGELKATEENDVDDGFKTPDSLDQEISLIKQCPPAPRKPKTLQSIKRKGSNPNARRTLQLDLSLEVKSLFPSPILADFYRQIKKARRDD